MLLLVIYIIAITAEAMTGALSAGRRSMDWFGVVLMGMAGGALLYKDLGRRFPLPDISAWPPVRGLIFLGRNSLAIYILHQPLLLGLIYLAEGPSLFSFAWK